MKRLERGQNFVEYAIIVLLALVVIALLFTLAITTSRDGVHVGYITAIDKTGIFWQNYNVYVKTENESSQEDIYCISRDDIKLAEGLRQASIDRMRVEVQYHSIFTGMTFPIFSNGACSGDIIDGFTVLGN